MVKIKEEKEKVFFSSFSLTVIKKINQITITPRERRQKLDE